MASAFENLSLDDAEYIIFNMPQEGFDQINTFFNNFSNIDFGDVYTGIEFTSNKFQIVSELIADDFNSNLIQLYIMVIIRMEIFYQEHIMVSNGSLHNKILTDESNDIELINSVSHQLLKQT